MCFNSIDFNSFPLPNLIMLILITSVVDSRCSVVVIGVHISHEHTLEIHIHTPHSQCYFGTH